MNHEDFFNSLCPFAFGTKPEEEVEFTFCLVDIEILKIGICCNSPLIMIFQKNDGKDGEENKEEKPKKFKS